jgi:nicotinate-nucleotide adenylyltransferase
VTRIGVFGGEFDPPHNGHVMVVRSARDQLRLDRVLVVPTGYPPHRPAAETPAETRYRLAQAAFAGEPNVEVSRLELDRDGPSYTVDTLEQLARPGVDLYLIVGADQLAALSSWHRPDRVRDLAHLVVAGRPGAPYPADAEQLVMPPVDVSSSELRRKVAEGMDVAGLMPPAVVEAIGREGLYAPTPC